MAESSSPELRVQCAIHLENCNPLSVPFGPENHSSLKPLRSNFGRNVNVIVEVAALQLLPERKTNQEPAARFILGGEQKRDVISVRCVSSRHDLRSGEVVDTDDLDRLSDIAQIRFGDLI